METVLKYQNKFKKNLTNFIKKFNGVKDLRVSILRLVSMFNDLKISSTVFFFGCKNINISG